MIRDLIAKTIAIYSHKRVSKHGGHTVAIFDQNERLAVNQKTRDIYHKQHMRMEADDITRTRMMGLTTEDFFEFPQGFLRGQKVLDAGCGSILRNAIAFYRMEAQVTAMDLGDEWFNTARQNMSRYDVPLDGITFASGSVDNLPFDAASFDFVCCDGVIPHLADTVQVEKAISELGRITKVGGYLFISFLAGGGLIETVIHDAVRRFYKENSQFSALIDRLTPEIFDEFVKFALSNMHYTTKDEFDINIFKTLFDEDLCISIQNICQAEKRERYSIDYIKCLLQKYGFDDNYKRLKRYVKRQNIRKFFAPFHYYSENIYAEILYGEGYVDMIVKKTDLPL